MVAHALVRMLMSTSMDRENPEPDTNTELIGSLTIVSVQFSHDRILNLSIHTRLAAFYPRRGCSTYVSRA